jgi:5-methylcytosine-specific restriction endonuclease McrA
MVHSEFFGSDFISKKELKRAFDYYQRFGNDVQLSSYLNAICTDDKKEIDRAKKRRRQQAQYYIGKNGVREAVLERCNHQCVNCGKEENLQIDHILPISRGGEDKLDNLQVLCRTCNVEKGSKTMSQWKGED